jgi:hypothetical protein
MADDHGRILPVETTHKIRSNAPLTRRHNGGHTLS